MDAPGDTGLYSPTQKVVHQILNWVDDTTSWTVLVRAPPSSTQKAVHIRKSRTEAVVLNSSESHGGASCDISNTEHPQANISTVRTESERERKTGKDAAGRRKHWQLIRPIFS